jgi:hypothetical protein
MKIETFLYLGYNEYQPIAIIKDFLPLYVQKAELKRKTDSKNSIEINAENHQAVEYLDKVLANAILEGKCERIHRIEIDKQEIPYYDYFHVLPIPLEDHKQVFSDVKMPDCYNESSDCNCFIGSKLLSPVKVKMQKAINLDIATVNYPWEKEVVLFLSARMKNIFEREGVIDLIYEPAQFITSSLNKKIIRENGICRTLIKEKSDANVANIENPYIARMPHKVYLEADKIFYSKLECEFHSSISSGAIQINPRIQKKEITNIDFFQIDGVRVEGRMYPYNINYFCLSRKALEILLKHKAKGLSQVGVFIKSKFSPVIEVIA